nr:TonB-dependent receptor [uncultured Holophaga sp.]
MAASSAAEIQSQGEDPASPIQLESVSVKAKRTKEDPASPYAVTESSQVQTQVFTREDIEALHPQSTWDVLEQIPGFQVEEMGHKHQEWYYFQGTQSAMGVIVDGVYLTQLDRVLSTLPVESIESITVVRDATALTLGPLTNFSAMGSGYGGGSTGSSNQGFILIKTRRASGREGSVSAGYGSYNAQKYGLSLGDRKGGFDYRISGSFKDDPGKPGWNMKQRNATVYFKGGYTGQSFEADFMYAFQHGMQEGRNVTTVYPTGSYGSYDYSKVGSMSVGGGGVNFPRLDLSMAGLNVTKRWSATQSTSVSVGYSGFTCHMNFNGTLSDQNTYSTTFSLRHVIATEANTFKTGFQRFTYLAPNNVSGGSYYRDEETMNGYFVENEHRFLGGRLSVDGGVRIDQKSFDTGLESGSTASETRAKVAPAYSLGAAWQASPRLTLTTRFGHTENDPSKYQVSSTGATLHTEERNRYEVGAVAKVHRFFNPTVAVYYYDTKNQKSVTGKYYIDTTTLEEYDYVTEGNVRTHGLDLGATGQLFQPLSYQLSWSIVGTDSASANNSIARHSGNANLRYQEGAFGANLSAHYVGPMYQSYVLTGVTPYPLGDYTRIDANLNYAFLLREHEAKVTLYGRNLTDKHYATKMDSSTAAATDPGVSCGVELRLNLF